MHSMSRKNSNIMKQYIYKSKSPKHTDGHVICILTPPGKHVREIYTPFNMFNPTQVLYRNEWPPIGKIAARSAYDMFLLYV